MWTSGMYNYGVLENRRRRKDLFPYREEVITSMDLRPISPTRIARFS